MAKDPAFLFYSSDFLSGTILMSDEQVGKYIRLLCIQHQKGRLREKDMLNICKTYDEDIFCKFNKDEEGLFYNQRLEDVSNKRKAYSESRRNNRLSDKKEDMLNISETYDKHMENGNGIETVIKTVNEKNLIPPTIEMVKKYADERKSTVNVNKFYDFYESKNWMVGKTKMKDWQASFRTWDVQAPKKNRGYSR